MFYFGRVTFPNAELLIIFNLLALILFFYQIKKGVPDNSYFKLSFYTGFMATFAPLVSLLMALYVFTLVHSHPTRQLSAGNDSWGIWYQFWLFALFWHGFSFLLLLYSFFVEHDYHKYKRHFIYRLVVLALLLISAVCLLQNFPDA